MKTHVQKLLLLLLTLIVGIAMTACVPIQPPAAAAVASTNKGKSSVGKVLQVHFQYDIKADEYRAAATSLAAKFAAVKGMRWKIWTLNEENKEAGGIFLFDDEASRQGYLDGLYAEVIGSNPAFHDAVIKKFDVIEDATAVTRGPIR